MRRIVGGLAAFLAFTGTMLVLPVYAAPGPTAHPVKTAVHDVTLGSVTHPATDAVVTADGQALPGGVTEAQATGAVPTPVPPRGPAGPSIAGATPAGAATPTGSTGATPAGTTGAGRDVARSGRELRGVPALTVSEPATQRFSTVGVTWQQDDLTNVVVQLRVRKLDGHWSGWNTLDADDTDPAGSGADLRAGARGGTSPYFTGPARGVQAIVQGTGGVVPRDVKVTLINPGTSAADKVPAAPAATAIAHAADSMPPVYSRAQWGADESIRTWDPEYAPTIKAFALHHTDNANDYTADQVPGIIRSIYTYHAVTRGWGDIGYNVLVDKFGRLWEGRYGGLASTVIGAHTGGFNYDTFAISMIGNYDEVPVPQATVDAISQFVAWKFSLYGVDPNGWTTLVSAGGGTDKYAAGVAVPLPTIFGHRDTGNTTCPGRYGYARLGDIRSEVAGLIDLHMSAIQRRYLTDPALQTALGAEVGTEQYGSGFAFQDYEHGRLYWSATTGVHLVRGDILTAYLAAGGPAVLGAPTTDEGRAGAWGAFNEFADDASIYWTADTGAHIVRGAIRARWRAMGAEWGMGFPTGEETGVSGGVEQKFLNGDVYWSATTGAHELRGGIAAGWSAAGGLPVLGLPTTGERPGAGGSVLEDFSRGWTVVWTPSATHRVAGGIRAAWLAEGGDTGALGLPETDEQNTPDPGGRYSTFAGGSVVWTGTAGGVVLDGPIGDRWAAAGGVDSSLGLPTAPRHPTSDGQGQVVSFASGAAIYWSSANGAHLVRGAVGARWTALGGLQGLGLPVSDETALGRGSGVYQLFRRGKIFWSSTTGAYEVIGAVGAAYDSVGAEWSALGLPISAEYGVPGGTRQDFQHGSISWNATTGATAVAYR